MSLIGSKRLRRRTRSLPGLNRQNSRNQNNLTCNLRSPLHHDDRHIEPIHDSRWSPTYVISRHPQLADLRPRWLLAGQTASLPNRPIESLLTSVNDRPPTVPRSSRAPTALCMSTIPRSDFGRLRLLSRRAYERRWERIDE